MDSETLSQTIIGVAGIVAVAIILVAWLRN